MLSAGEAQSKAVRLHGEVRDHKRAIRQHRQLAREKMAELGELCRRWGIRIETQGEGGTHGRPEDD